MAKIEAFERHSGAYDDWFRRNAEAYAAELALMRRLLPPAGGLWLEVGVGSGKFAVPLGISIGVEPSAAMAAKARQRCIRVIAGVAEHLPLADARFDLVLMVTTICFVDDVAASFAETLRVLKPGGLFILGFVDKESELGRTYEANREQSRFYREATFFSARQVAGHMEAAGFRIEQAGQTLIAGEPEGRLLEGYGRGAFVGLRGVRSR